MAAYLIDGDVWQEQAEQERELMEAEDYYASRCPKCGALNGFCTNCEDQDEQV